MCPKMESQSFHDDLILGFQKWSLRRESKYRKRITYFEMKVGQKIGVQSRVDNWQDPSLNF
jgi:hypothetical protein